MIGLMWVAIRARKLIRFQGITSLGAFANCCPPHKVSLRILEQDQTPSILHFHCLVFYAPDVLEFRFHTLYKFLAFELLRLVLNFFT